MTQKEAQVRNNKIMQFRGIETRVRGLIQKMFGTSLEHFERIRIIEAQRCYEEVIKILNSKAKCRHSFYEEHKMVTPRCCLCGHIKYSRDGLGKAGTF